MSLVVGAIFAQPSNTAEFNHRGVAIAGCEAAIDGEGSFLDIFDFSNGENPAASHFNEAYRLRADRIDKIGGADRFAFDIGFRTLEYPGPTEDGEKRSWYWIDGIGRIMVDKGFGESFSTRFQFNGGYNTMRNSFWGLRYRHNYTAAVPDWSNISKRASTTGAAALLPLGEFYFNYHSPFGLSVGAGGGYGFSEFEDLYYSRGWHTLSKGNVTSYAVKMGGRFAVPEFEQYGAIGVSYGIKGGKVRNEDGDDYDMFDTGDDIIGFQAEFGYPGYVRGAFGYDKSALNEDFFTSATDTIAETSEDEVARTSFGVQVYGDEFRVPVTLGFRTESYATEGRSINASTVTNENKLSWGDTRIGLSAEPIEGWTIAAEYKKGYNKIESGSSLISTNQDAQVDLSAIAGGMEIYVVPEFGIRFGFENFSLEPDSIYKSEFGSFDVYYGGEGDYVAPYFTPSSRYGLVPVQTRGNALSWGFVFRLDDQRLILELSGRHVLASEPQVYRDNAGTLHEGYVGLTYYLK